MPVTIHNTAQIPRFADLSRYDVRDNQLQERSLLQKVYRSISDYIRTAFSDGAKFAIATRNAQVAMKIHAMNVQERATGAANNNIHHTTRQAVSAFLAKVQTAPFSAEQYRGRVYDYVRNSLADALNHPENLGDMQRTMNFLQSFEKLFFAPTDALNKENCTAILQNMLADLPTDRGLESLGDVLHGHGLHIKAHSTFNGATVKAGGVDIQEAGSRRQRGEIGQEKNMAERAAARVVRTLGAGDVAHPFMKRAHAEAVLMEFLGQDYPTHGNLIGTLLGSNSIAKLTKDLPYHVGLWDANDFAMLNEMQDIDGENVVGIRAIPLQDTNPQLAHIIDDAGKEFYELQFQGEVRYGARDLNIASDTFSLTLHIPAGRQQARVEIANFDIVHTKNI